MKRVVKFGGSNLKDAESIKSVIEVFKNYGKEAVFVVSALSGTTEFLLSVARESLESESAISRAVAGLRSRHEEIILSFAGSREGCQAALEELNTILSGLERALLGVNYLGSLSDEAHDLVLSYGERLSSAILKHLLIIEGQHAIVRLPEEIGLITNGKYGRASVKIDKARPGVLKACDYEGIVIIPGFYGVNPDGKPTLLGRGGSDYSAAVIAAIIKAESLDLWKDTDGFLSADPKLAGNTEAIPRLTYSEAAELSYFGAKILHPRTVDPLEKYDIPIRIFNIKNSVNSSAPATIISGERGHASKTIKSVTYSNDFGLVKIQGASVGFMPGIISKAAGALDKQGMKIKSIITSQTSINFLLDCRDIRPALAIISDIDELEGATVAADASISVVALVGEGITEQYGIAGRALSALSNRCINVPMLAMGASEVSAYLVVERSNCSRAVNLIHDEFFKSGAGVVI